MSEDKEKRVGMRQGDKIRGEKRHDKKKDTREEMRQG